MIIIRYSVVAWNTSTESSTEGYNLRQKCRLMALTGDT